jgi:hypothetical protein
MPLTETEDKRLQDCVAALEDALRRGREIRARRDAERRADILARMEAGEEVWLADAVWATDGECLQGYPLDLTEDASDA